MEVEKYDASLWLVEVSQRSTPVLDSRSKLLVGGGRMNGHARLSAFFRKPF
jgi:hypothetical protein